MAACGSHARSTTLPPERVHPATGADRILPLLPDGAQVIVELDLARLRANPVIGAVATRALAQVGGDRHVPGLPFAVSGSPLAAADQVVLASYGVGTPQAATIVVLATKAEVPGGVKIAPDLVALGPDTWVGQLATRAAIAQQSPLVAPEALLQLRDHAMPAGATGAVIRVTARLTFDARIAIARDTGLDAPPAQLSLWGDVADDLAIVVDADADDPGDRSESGPLHSGPGARAGKDAARRLAATVRAELELLAGAPTVRALGVPYSLEGARLIAQGTWVRAIIAIGPRHLARAAQRAGELLGASS